MKELTLKAKAKINLFLEITGILPNGYHEISTVMHEIGLWDTVVLTPTDTGKITVTSDSTRMPLDERNIAYRCAAAFFEATGINNPGVNIHIEKNIPIEAGMGGGSADGAAVLKGLNEMHDYPMAPPALCDIGARVGADIPFCIMGGTMLCRGIGEVMTPVAPLPDCTILVAKGRAGVSTKEAYQTIDALPDRRIRKNNMPELLEKGNLARICDGMYNCFEISVPWIEDIKADMTAGGCTGCMMSGSGSAVFGIYDDHTKAETACKKLRDKGLYARICDEQQI